MSTAVFSYDEIPYTTRPRRITHPDTLATVATLMGLKPAPVETCRVLELGCGTGGNMLPMAAALPRGKFTGIDLSAVQIDAAHKVVNELGLTNVDFRAASIMDIDESWGRFDYIICHGVYSWVPPFVQEKILAICSNNLEPHGVAYVSYNVYPGWHLRGPVREMLGFHVHGLESPQDRVRAAREFIQFLDRGVTNPTSTYGRLIREEAALLGAATDDYLAHEHLEDENHPLYFHEFLKRAGGHGLKYLGDALPDNRLNELPEEMRETLQHVCPDLETAEQYLDFLYNRTFRRSLLVPASAPIDRSPSPNVIMGLLASSGAKPESGNPDVKSNAVESFKAGDGTKLSSNTPAVKAVLTALWEAWPQPLKAEDVAAAAAAKLGNGWPADPRIGRHLTAQVLLQSYLNGVVRLHSHVSPFVSNLSERPAAFPISRWSARNGLDVVTGWHQEIRVGNFDRFLIPLVDGSRTVPDLIAEVKQSKIELPETAGGSAEKAVADCLSLMAWWAVLQE